MEVTEKYGNLKERAEKIGLRESQKLRMLHDDFDAGWKAGDEPHGTMTFTDIEPPINPIVDWQAQWDATVSIDQKVPILAKMLGLQ